MKCASAVVLLLALSTSGCAAFSDDDGGGSPDGKVSVAAAFYPLAYVSERVGGDHVEVTNLTQPGQEPHDLTLSVKETADVQDADLVVLEHGLQPAVDAAADEVANGTVLDAADVVDLLPMDEDDHEHSADSTEEEPGHDHGELDPHFWLDPQRMAALSEAVADELSDIDPDHAEDYRDNADTLKADLDELATEYTEGLQNCERDTIVVSHDAFGYLAPYGLHVEGIAGLSPDAEPTPADLARLQDLIESEGITTVFGERLVSPKLAETLARDAGVTTAVLDPIEGLSDETSGEDYLSLMRENLSALELANGCS
jgi:zinc transport system substrate-binding protein